MDNYFVNNENEYYDNPYVSKSKPKVKHKHKPINSKYIIYGIVIIILIIVVSSIVKSSSVDDNSYLGIENKMVKKARDYISRNDISDKETYVDVSKMGISLPNNCNLLSGVFYNNGEYTPYLLCSDYESKITNLDDSKILNGKEIILLTRGSNYYELGSRNLNNYQVSGVVNTLVEGVYNIYYIPNLGKNYVVRKVVVVDNPSANSRVPNINFNDNLKVLVGQSYDNTLSAYDSLDGDITSRIIRKEVANTNEIGEYKNVYSVTNSLGYTKIVAQNISVYDEEETNILIKLSDDNMTNQNVDITIKILGDKFSSLQLPDGESIEDKEYTYEVSENGTYEFIVIEKSGSKIVKKVKIDNIDKTTPTGTCRAISYNDKTVFNVSITSFNHVVGYNYSIDSKSSGYLTGGSYTAGKTTSKNLSVMVKDYIGNTATIKCSVDDQKTYFDPKGYHTLIEKGKPRLHIPIGDALARKGYTISDLNKCIYKRVQEAGPYTRWGVTAAAFGLIDCTYTMTGYVLPYNHSGGKVIEERTSNGGSTTYCTGINADICGKLGVNRNWGKQGGTCSSETCWYGLNCATFVRWSMCNGGMDLCSKGSAGSHDMTSVTYFPEADGVEIKGTKVAHYCGRNLTNYSAEQLLRMIKPGDAIATGEGGGHTFVVVGIDNNGIYTAEDGYFMRYIKFSTMTNGKVGYRILLLDRYYDNPKNRNNLYG